MDCQMRSTFFDLEVPDKSAKALKVENDADTGDLKLKVWTDDLHGLINSEHTLTLLEKEKDNELNMQETSIKVSFADPCELAELSPFQAIGSIKFEILDNGVL